MSKSSGIRMMIDIANSTELREQLLELFKEFLKGVGRKDYEQTLRDTVEAKMANSNGIINAWLRTDGRVMLKEHIENGDNGRMQAFVRETVEVAVKQAVDADLDARVKTALRAALR